MTRRAAVPPPKLCATCKRPFDWRKKWERVWGEVKYCSEACRRQKARPKPPETP